MTKRLRDWPCLPAVLDAVLALVFLLVGAAADLGWSESGVPNVDPADRAALWWVATVLAAVAIALRRRLPVRMTAVAAASVMTHLLLGLPLEVVDLGVLVLLYTVAVRYRRTVSITVLGVLVGLAAGWSVHNVLVEHRTAGPPDPGRRIAPVPPRPGQLPPPPDPSTGDPSDVFRDELFVCVSALLAAWAIGFGTRSRRAHLDELRARARELERDRDLQAAFAVAAERGRISRELHDVVAHGLSVMVIQAQGGAAALDSRPADTRSALDAIIRTGRDSLADMRRVIAAVGAVEDTWHPQPGLAQLTALVGQVRKAGTPVGLEVEGTAAPLPSTVDLSAYRIVQEALTNTMKHAGRGAKAEVVLSYTDEGVVIRVSDDGRGPDGGTDGGNGLRGMRERARLLGGSLVAEPGPDGGFVVLADLPIRGSGR
ncbi:sensor histidine kinase [Umezawaea sp. Da 62-37]|uniref:sensor histidine kinase n=1 Tax=Umezawaea sp. Da 62-37 TaxID=3075927 RepID=UPI0028F6C18E|nr:sensor histidine kinase [Umezawaea sp. Da 62-37]WNV88520.1 sensor histidine kinase [Umezawaea sp. Da 62-37]